MNSVKNQLTGEYGAVPDVARAYKAAGQDWIVIGDENYGEGRAAWHCAVQWVTLAQLAVRAGRNPPVPPISPSPVPPPTSPRR